MTDSPWIFAAAAVLAAAWLLKPLVSHWLDSRCQHQWEFAYQSHWHTVSASFLKDSEYMLVQPLKCSLCGECTWRRI